MARAGEGMKPSIHTLVLDHVSPATRLLEKRRQMFEVQAALDAQKEEFARREEAFRRREEGLRKKDLDLQEALIKLNKFLQESETKRNRALKRAEDEAKAKNQKMKQIEELKETLDRLKREKAAVVAEEKSKDKYRQYLLSVQNYVDDDYHDISQLLDRYQTLKLAYEDIKRAQEAAESEMDRQRQRLNELKKEKTNRLFESNTRKAGLQKELERTEQSVAAMQADVETAVESSKEKASELGKVLMAVKNLLKRCVDGRAFPKHTETERGPEAFGDEAAVHHDEPKLTTKTVQWFGKGAGLGTQDSDKPKTKARVTPQDEEAKKLEERTRQAMANLLIIADYITDFEDIIAQAKKDRETGTLPSTTKAAGLDATTHKDTSRGAGAPNRFGGVLSGIGAQDSTSTPHLSGGGSSGALGQGSSATGSGFLGTAASSGSRSALHKKKEGSLPKL